MAEYLEFFWEELYSFFDYLIDNIINNSILQIFFGVFLILGLTGAVLRVIFS